MKFLLSLSAFLFLACSVRAVTIDRAELPPSSPITVETATDSLRATWKSTEGDTCECVLNFTAGKPLLGSLTIGGKRIASDVQPVYRLAIGKRKKESPESRYTFFDKVFATESDVVWNESKLEPKNVKVSGAGGRATIEIDGMSAGSFRGALHLNFYAGSPFVLVQAVMTQDRPDVAYSYDVVLEGSFPKQSWMNLGDKMTTVSPQGETARKYSRFRTIMGGNDAGTLAVFPPPHAYFHPKDEANNFGFVQAGARGIGICQTVTEPKFRPLIDAPPGQFQRMSIFLLGHAGDAAATLERVKRYTHGDSLKRIDGYTTLVTHEHAALTVNDGQTPPPALAFVRACKRTGIDIMHLAEFHGEQGSMETDLGAARVDVYRRMNELCRKYSDGQLLLLPGEEPNFAFPGHWMILFPKPTIFTRGRKPEQPFKEEVSGVGTVYHPGNTDEAHQMLIETGGLAWTAHPRIKSSRRTPDLYRETPWYQSPQWLGGTWKSMPSDLSQPRLGVRCLDLLDDMNLWGQRKFIVGEFDCFRIDDSSEFYGNLNASYLRLSRKPTLDDASPVIECLKRGDYFVTTGEVLIHSWAWEENRAVADVEWTLPLAHAELIVCDGQQVKRETIAIDDTSEFGQRRFEFPVKTPNAKWVRVEFWDIADDGAFTQPIYR